MVESMQPLDWDLLNSDQKYEFCGKSVHLWLLLWVRILLQ